MISMEDSIPDVAYHLNHLTEEYVTINCAIEESSLGERKAILLPQDEFVRDHIKEEDLLIVSAGGNDVALKPSISTIWNILKLTKLNFEKKIIEHPEKCWGINHFESMFRVDAKDYIDRVTSNKRPNKVVICMIYFPDEKMTGSWSDTTLGYLGVCFPS